MITLPTVLDTGSRPTEHGESSSEPSLDTTFDDASDELMEAESIPPVVEEGTL